MRLAGTRGLPRGCDALAAALLPRRRRPLLFRSLIDLRPPLVFSQEDVEVFRPAADGSAGG